MFKKSIILVFGLILSIAVFSQNRTDSIQRYKFGGGYRYEQSGKVLSLRDMTTLMKNNPEAGGYLRNAKGANAFSSILSFSGGVLIGVPIGKLINGRNFDWTMFAVGCGLAVVSIPITISSNNNMKMAVDSFNRDKTVSGTIHKGIDLTLGVTQSGLGLTMKF